MSSGLLLVVIVFRLAAAGGCAAIASHKGRSVVGWAVLGLLLEIFALIAIVCLPKLTPDESTVPADLLASPQEPATPIDVAAWTSLLQRIPTVGLIAERLAPLGTRYVEIFAAEALKSQEPAALEAAAQTALERHRRDTTISERMKELEARGGGVGMVFETPWGGIITLQNNWAVVFKNGRCEVLDDISSYHEKYKGEETYKWIEITTEAERSAFYDRIAAQGYSFAAIPRAAT